MKACVTCEETKPETAFYSDRSRADGLYPSCRKCAAASKQASNRKRRTEDPDGWWERRRGAVNRYAERHPDQMRRYWRRRLLQKHGLTLEEFEELAENQGGRCVICGAKPNRKNLRVDHDHQTGRIRGLLCDNCNLALGHVKDSVEILRRMMEYLER